MIGREGGKARAVGGLFCSVNSFVCFVCFFFRISFPVVMNVVIIHVNRNKKKCNEIPPEMFSLHSVYDFFS